MAAAAPRPRDLADRPRLQPAGRRAARRLRPASGLARAALTVSLALASCGGERPPPAAPPPPPERAAEFRERFLSGDWEDAGAWDARGLVAGLRRYVDGDDPILPRDDPRCRALHEYLYARRPDPDDLAPLLGPRGDAAEIGATLLKRDLVAIGVTTSFIRRLARDPDDPHRAALHRNLARAWLEFGFDPLYQASHTGTSEEVVDFYAGADFTPDADSRRALAAVLEDKLARWRKRVSTKATSTFFGIVMRHLGTAGTDRLFGEWEHMDAGERYDLLRRVADRERPGPAARAVIVEAVLAADPDLREAALDALAAFDAPLGGVDMSSREADRRAVMPALRRWAAETES